jgi:hypothetical protein
MRIKRIGEISKDKNKLKINAKKVRQVSNMVCE